MSEKLILYFLSVGNGHSTYIEFPNGQNALVDINACSGKHNPIQLLKNAGIYSLDYLIITHPHRDHISGLTELVKHITIRCFIWSPVYFKPDPVYEDWETYENIKARLRYSARTIFEHTIGGTPFFNGLLYGGVNVSYFLPRYTLLTDTNNVNDKSLIVRLVYGKSRILICGDTEKTGWERIPDFKIKNTTLLLASHHGNNTGYSLEKVNVMFPKYVVISAGDKTEADADNKYRYHTSKWDIFIKALGGTPSKRVFTTRDSAVIATFTSQGLESIRNA
jgi:competence protein ComEC